jgi:hypothetical protein
MVLNAFGRFASMPLVSKTVDSHGRPPTQHIRFTEADVFFPSSAVATNYGGSAYPLSFVAHSADNSYLQNATSVMTPFEKGIALEWRAYIGSFIRTGNPNSEKLASAPSWPNYGALGDFVNSPVRLVPQFAYSSNGNTRYSTSTQLEVSQKAQIEREDWWTSDAVLDSTRV